MKLRFDEKADAVYLRLDEDAIVESEEVQPGIILDYNKAGTVVGVEFLDVSKRIKAKDLKRLQFETT